MAPTILEQAVWLSVAPDPYSFRLHQLGCRQPCAGGTPQLSLAGRDLLNLTCLVDVILLKISVNDPLQASVVTEAYGVAQFMLPYYETSTRDLPHGKSA